MLDPPDRCVNNDPTHSGRQTYDILVQDLSDIATALERAPVRGPEPVFSGGVLDQVTGWFELAQEVLRKIDQDDEANRLSAATDYGYWSLLFMTSVGYNNLPKYMQAIVRRIWALFASASLSDSVLDERPLKNALIGLSDKTRQVHDILAQTRLVRRWYRYRPEFQPAALAPESMQSSTQGMSQPADQNNSSCGSLSLASSDDVFQRPPISAEPSKYESQSLSGQSGSSGYPPVFTNRVGVDASETDNTLQYNQPMSYFQSGVDESQSHGGNQEEHDISYFEPPPMTANVITPNDYTLNRSRPMRPGPTSFSNHCPSELNYYRNEHRSFPNSLMEQASHSGAFTTPMNGPGVQYQANHEPFPYVLTTPGFYNSTSYPGLGARQQRVTNAFLPPTQNLGSGQGTSYFQVQSEGGEGMDPRYPATRGYESFTRDMASVPSNDEIQVTELPTSDSFVPSRWYQAA